MDFGTNKTPVEIIKVVLVVLILEIFGKSFKELKSIDWRYYASDYYDVGLNKSGVKCGTSLRFWEDKGWINPIDPYGWF